ncbi:uncharacterized protein LTHEOB_7663 [Neofusicoccum parvum]|nr:uncharacterized protein LTHEOB_7663 [Neofusicoccum parvum]
MATVSACLHPKPALFVLGQMDKPVLPSKNRTRSSTTPTANLRSHVRPFVSDPVLLSNLTHTMGHVKFVPLSITILTAFTSRLSETPSNGMVMQCRVHSVKLPYIRRLSQASSDGSSDSVPSPQNSDPGKTMGQATSQSAAEQNLGSVVGQTSAQLNKASYQVLLPAVGSMPGTPQSNLLEDGDQGNTPPKRKATALENSKPAKKARTIKTEGKSEDQLLREARDVSYALAHPPENAYQSTRITRSWLNHAFPDHFRDNKRMIKTRSEMLALGPARLNVSATYWKALNEENREVRPPIPMHIKDRQVVRCDEGHSLEPHSPAGSKSIACVDCGVQSFGNKHNFTTQHMMCAACIGKHEDELSGESRLESLLKGGAWATLCDECMENCNQLPSCGCEWEKPRCIQHRRVHLEKLSRRKPAIGIRLQLCGHCNERPVSKGISYAWHCQICSGVFVLPNDIPSTWFPHLDPYKETSIANSAQKTHQDAMQGLGTMPGALPLAEPGSDSDFDFSCTGSSGTISEPQQAIIPGSDISGAAQTKP